MARPGAPASVLALLALLQCTTALAGQVDADDYAIALGGRHSCWITDDAVLCWGDSSHGKLGKDDLKGAQTQPVVVDALLAYTVDALTAGYDHTCAVVRASPAASLRFLQCWGANYNGQLGDASKQDRSQPILVPLDPVITASAGGSHTCAVTQVGELFCWGSNTNGQLGDGTTLERLRPVKVAIESVKAVSAGATHTCALTTSQAVYCWGSNSRGELGDGTTQQRSVPTLVPGLTASNVSAGQQFTCALNDAARVVCWGSNGRGQLGRVTEDPFEVIPAEVVVSSRIKFSSVAVGGQHACAVEALPWNRIFCWGDNDAGQLGILSTDSTPNVTNLMIIKAPYFKTLVFAGSSHTAMHYQSSPPFLWGSNTDGQLGDGTLVPRSYLQGFPAPKTCKNFTQGGCQSGYLLKPHPAGVWGSSSSTCCEASCALFSCGFGYTRKPNAGGIAGASKGVCCEQVRGILRPINIAAFVAIAVAVLGCGCYLLRVRRKRQRRVRGTSGVLLAQWTTTR